MLHQRHDYHVGFCRLDASPTRLAMVAQAIWLIWSSAGNHDSTHYYFLTAHFKD